ncbi:hypothetical protein EDD11_000357, partial [Mortierella claussenii]
MWKNLSNPAQVVLRYAAPSIIRLSLDPVDGPISEQLLQRVDPRKYRIDLSQAPLTGFVIAQDIDGRWMVVQLLHHLIGDHSTLEEMNREIQAFIEGRGELLPEPQPFRNLIAQIRSGRSDAEQEQFFTKMLAEIDTPALPFGLSDVHRDGLNVTEHYRLLPQDLNVRLRAHAKRIGAGSGADRALGLFINTLPVRVDLESTGIQESVCQIHARLAALLDHEHASLALAQRCSSVSAGIPLFSSLLNYRHIEEGTSVETRIKIDGMEIGQEKERTNYPFVMNVEDFGNMLGLTAQIVQPLDAVRITAYMQQALQGLADALKYAPNMPVQELEILPLEERDLLLQIWNTTEVLYPDQ